MPDSWITVFGGTGFLGKRIVGMLAGGGAKVRVATRDPGRPSAAGASADTIIDHVRADVRNPGSIARAVAGAQGVVNAVGLYAEHGGETFEAIHVVGAGDIADEAAKAGVARLVHVSGIGIDQASRSPYVRSRARGEDAATEAFPNVTILRPSVLFAPDDNFINLLLRFARLMPAIPLFGDGSTLLQPVFAGDVAAAAIRALEDPAAPGRTYELGGPGIYSYRELLELVMAHGGRRRGLLPVPFALWDVQARLAGLLPNPPLTRDQVALMRHDNVVSAGLPGLADLGITPTSLEGTLPDYPA
jgi:NADH dehydrogenase